jgi:3-oxoacyl-[acyl-carrier protein] reductase
MNALNTAATSMLPPGARIAIVGACGGIGRSLVTACIAAQLRVAALDLGSSIARHPPPASALAVPCDASDAVQVGAAFAQVEQQFGALDGLVNLVGFKLATLSIEATPPELWDEGIAGNLRSAYLVSRAALPLLRRGSGAAIVHVSSGLGSHGGRGYGPYAAAKGAINTLVRILANECGPAIRANAVAPGYIDTAFARGGTGRSNEDELPAIDAAAHASRIPAGRIGTPQDVVGPVLFLLGPGSAYVNGQILHVNGGGYLP